MPMRIYNSLSRSVETFHPLHKDMVSIYTCGPTVYDYAHVGHWFNYVRMDMLVRTLKASSYQTNWVMNITDVGHLTSDADDGEDKLEKGAHREGKTAWEIAARYGDDFLMGMKKLNMLTPDHIVKATDHIADQIALISRLEQKGYSYVIDDGVYFDVSKFPGYGAFASLDLDSELVVARVAQNTQKKQAADFALWKFSPRDSQRDMEWESPWGIGFPGWHIECSAMSMKYLGDTLDIHTGGIDHIPVHHTNEIAQSEAATGKPFAHYWLHSNHVMVNGEKISKSLGNGISLHDVNEAGISSDALRLHILESHYRSQSKFSWESLQAAQNRLNDLRAMAVLRYQAFPTIGDSATFALEDVPVQLLNFLQEDLNTPQALAFLSDVSRQLQAVLIEDDMVDHYENMLRGIDNLLGLRLSEIPNISSEIRQLITTRELARQQKDWQRSDELRAKLEKHSITLRDTNRGPIWSWL